MTEESKNFNRFLKTIGGLENGYSVWPNSHTQPIRFFFFRLINGLGIEDYNNPFRKRISDRYFFNVDDGWLPLVQELIVKLIDAGWDRQVIQVKEKFGGLRFYIATGSKEIFDIISEYEKKSLTICERCGAPGQPRKGGWIKTLCDHHNIHRLL